MTDFWTLDITSLQSLYERHQKELTASLLEGAQWKEVQDQRKLVTELAIILYHRTTSVNPEEFNSRQPSSNFPEPSATE